MLIYGSRMYFKTDFVKSFGECEHCGSYCEKKSYKAKKFGHIYFIPIIPLGGHSQVLRECSSCDMGAHIPVAKLDPMVDGLSDQFKTWIMEIQDGKTEIVPDGVDEPVNAGVLIASILDDLYCLNEIQGVDSISAILESNHMKYENEFVLGRWGVIRGDLEGAKRAFQSAHELRPQEPIPLFQLGSVSVLLGNAEDAEAAFGKYSALEPDDVSPFIELSGLYEAQKNFPKIVESYDKIYSLHAEFIANKAMKKVYKKACKKAKVQGEFLAQM